MNQGQQLYSPLDTSATDEDMSFATAGDAAPAASPAIAMTVPPSYTDNTIYYASGPSTGAGLGPGSIPEPSDDTTGPSFTSILGTHFNTITDEERQTLVLAIAVPDTIRPPNMKINDTRNDPSNKIVRQIAIFFSGLIICSVSAFDAFLFLEYDWGNKLMYIAGFFWLCSALSLIIGTLYGTYKGQWRMLAPGIVLSHVAGFFLRLA